MENPTTEYAQLPSELLNEILDGVDDIASQANKLIKIDQGKIEAWRSELESQRLINKLDKEVSDNMSVMGVDGSCITNRMAGADLLLAAAVGIEGYMEAGQQGWEGNNQYHAWSQIVPHEEENYRLSQGLMHVLELSVISQARYDIMIMDGSHITPVLKLNSMMSAGNNLGGNPSYTKTIKGFMSSKLKSNIEGIPDILESAFADDKIIGINKYSSSRDLISSCATIGQDTSIDDKTLLSVALEVDEYTKPRTVGRSSEENKRWRLLHIDCNLPGIETSLRKAINNKFKKSLEQIRIDDDNDSSLMYTYFKPTPKLAYRIELKNGVARNENLLQRVLASLKRQVAYPFTLEPLPQFLADNMAHHISSSVRAIKDSLLHSPANEIDPNHMHLLMNYRSGGG